MSNTFIQSESIRDASANLCHEHSADPTWQESVVFAWGDPASGVSGFWRIGQEPLRGEVSSSFGVSGPDGLRFRHNVTGVSMTPGDRGPTHVAYEDKLRVDLDSMTITVNFPDCEGVLQFTDFLPMFDYMRQVGRTLDELGHHIEMPGKLTGSLRIGSQTLDVDALAHRDRSWGERDWSRVRVTRWWPCVFGPDMSLHMLAIVEAGTVVTRTGYFYKDGVIRTIANLDCLVTLDVDGLTTRAASGHMVLEDGERLDISFQPTDSFIMFVRGFSAAECMGTVTLGDRVGMSHLEVSNNPAGGNKPIPVSVGANNVDGMSRW